MALLEAGGDTKTPSVDVGRIAWAGPLTVVTSVAAVHAVRLIVIRLPHVNTAFVGFGVVPASADTIVLCSIAVIVFALLGAFHDDGIRRFRWIAFGALLVSFLPLMVTPEIANVPSALAVAAMHVAAYVPCVTLLPFVSRSRPGAEG